MAALLYNCRHENDFNVALKELVCGIILCHNHPSGNLQPSEQDKQLTKKIVEAAKLLEIDVLDHIIIAHQQYYSFTDMGIM